MFEYDFGTVERYEWDTEKLDYVPVISYEKDEQPGWIDDDFEIQFTNRSNRNVYVQTDFEKNTAVDCYNDVTFTTEKDYLTLETAVGHNNEPVVKNITYMISGEPDRHYDWKDGAPNLGYVRFIISDNAQFLRHDCNENVKKSVNDTETTGHNEYYCDICGALVRTEPWEHEHHYVYDQFGRLVCTGCNAVKHEYCIDEDEDGLCDECGMERDFCPDCHIGGTCKCT